MAAEDPRGSQRIPEDLRGSHGSAVIIIYAERATLAVATEGTHMLP